MPAAAVRSATEGMNGLRARPTRQGELVQPQGAGPIRRDDSTRGVP